MFRNPPLRWAKRGLQNRSARVATALVVMFGAPAMMGAYGPLASTEAPTTQSTTNTDWAQRTVIELQSSVLSELKANTGPGETLALKANVLASNAFVWPIHGDITSYMDSTHPMGIDIGLDYDSDSPIGAAARGTVTFAGGSDADTYGYYVKVDHGGGLVTLYAHLSEILVSQGQAVGQGEILGYGGSTGKSSGKHLHFEVRLNDYLANPLELLPPLSGESAEAQAALLDCDSGVFALNRGSTAQFDFTSSLPPDGKITEARVNSADGHPVDTGPTAILTSGKTLMLETMPSFASHATDDFYRLDLVVEGARRFEKTCQLQLHTMASTLTAYSDASVTAAYNNSPFEDPESFLEPTLEPEPTTAPAEPTAEVPPEATPTLVIPPDVPMLGELGTPTPAPTETPTPAPSATPTATPSPTKTATATPTPTEDAESTPTTESDSDD